MSDDDITRLRTLAQADAAARHRAMQWHADQRLTDQDDDEVHHTTEALRARLDGFVILELLDRQQRDKPAPSAMQVGCEGTDGLLRIHAESETCDVCAPPAPSAEPVNLNDPAVQKRLAAQWGYVPAPSAEPSGHVLYTTACTDKPAEICDRNGDVVLAQCRRCGKAEGELSGPCKSALSAEPVAWRYGASYWGSMDSVPFGLRHLVVPLYTTPPDHRAVMRQALDALLRGRGQILGVLVQEDQDAAIDALRAALEEK
jgi:hypothetical protein